jgi:hypothetical protein
MLDERRRMLNKSAMLDEPQHAHTLTGNDSINPARLNVAVLA